MKNIIFIAPPAAGKGTQSNLLENMGYKHISTGDLLRSESKSGSNLGISLKEIMKSGSLVSDDIILELLKKAMDELNGKPFILDGYPRNYDQAVILDKIIDDNYVVIYLNISEDEVVKRISGRMICPSCHKSYNINDISLAPKKANICDNCGVDLISRDDDNVESAKKRYEVFMKETSKVLDYYKNKNKLNEVSALNDTLVIHNVIKSFIERD